MEKCLFSCYLDVRDSDIDFQSIVANHWYQAFMGHGNNRMIDAVGYNVHDLHNKGYDCIIVKVEIEFKLPLKLGDRIRIDCDLQFKGSFQTIFVNELIRCSDDALVATGKWYGCVIGKEEDGPVEPIGLKEAKENYLKTKKES